MKNKAQEKMPLGVGVQILESALVGSKTTLSRIARRLEIQSKSESLKSLLRPKFHPIPEVEEDGVVKDEIGSFFKSKRAYKDETDPLEGRSPPRFVPKTLWSYRNSSHT